MFESYHVALLPRISTLTCFQQSAERMSKMYYGVLRLRNFRSRFLPNYDLVKKSRILDFVSAKQTKSGKEQSGLLETGFGWLSCDNYQVKHHQHPSSLSSHIEPP